MVGIYTGHCIPCRHVGDVCNLHDGFQGYWNVGRKSFCCMGLGNYKLCLVDWNWSCRYCLFYFSLNPETALEKFNQPCCRGNDCFCCYLCSTFSSSAYG